MKNIHRVTNALAAFVLITAILAIATGSRSQNSAMTRHSGEWTFRHS